MSIRLAGLELAHPIVNGSGTYDAIAARRAFGDALLANFPFSAYVSKTITLKPRVGNPPPRLYETPAGLINSIGLPNKGLDGYLAQDLPELAQLPVPLVTNVMGSTADELAALVEAVRALCHDRRVPSRLALESGMACGFGACFGCVVPIKPSGYLRLCVDGPVLDGELLAEVPAH